MCCNLEIKVACGFIFAILAVCLSSAAIARNTNWYIDTEVAASPGLAATVSWSATLYSWCLKAPASYVVNNSPAVSFTPTCWSLTESNPPFNPNNDATLNTLQTYIPEIASGLNAIAQGSMYNVAALAVSIALGVVYLILTALIWSAPASLNYMCLSICYKTIGFFWHFASWLGFVLWAGGLGKAQEDFTSNLGTNTQPSQWILVNNTASVAGFSLAVGASGVALISCCFGCFIWSSEVEAKSKGLNPNAQGGMPVLPPGAYIIPGQVNGNAPVYYAPAIGAPVNYAGSAGGVVAQSQFVSAAAPAPQAVASPAGTEVSATEVHKTATV